MQEKKLPFGPGLKDCVLLMCGMIEVELEYRTYDTTIDIAKIAIQINIWK